MTGNPIKHNLLHLLSLFPPCTQCVYIWVYNGLLIKSLNKSDTLLHMGVHHQLSFFSLSPLCRFCFSTRSFCLLFSFSFSRSFTHTYTCTHAHTHSAYTVQMFNKIVDPCLFLPQKILLGIEVWHVVWNNRWGKISQVKEISKVFSQR